MSNVLLPPGYDDKLGHIVHSTERNNDHEVGHFSDIGAEREYRKKVVGSFVISDLKLSARVAKHWSCWHHVAPRIPETITKGYTECLMR